MIDMFDFGDGAGPVPAHRHPNGGGWVADTAYVAPTAYVGPGAQVFESAQVLEHALVCDGALVYGRVQLSGHAAVRDHAVVRGNARVSEDAEVTGNALVGGCASLLGGARVGGSALVCGGKWPRSPLYIEGSVDSVTMCAPGKLAIGCQVHSIEHWLACGREIGKEYGYTEAELEEYERYIRLAAEMCSEEGGDE